jgi:hypothetical protein
MTIARVGTGASPVQAELARLVFEIVETLSPIA